MTRISDINPSSTTAVPSIPIPAVNWANIHQNAPVPVTVGPRKPEDALPEADIVIVTWTSAEWSALDQVFMGRTTEREAEDMGWRTDWLPYTRGAKLFSADPKSGPLWGFFQLVSIKDQSNRPWRVLLFKSNSHLAHPPWIEGLSAMLRCIFEDSKADRIYSIGTAGGSRTSERLGDAVITNCALLDLQRPQNTTDSSNGSMFRCQTWFPATAFIEGNGASSVGRLLYRMDQTVSMAALQELFAELMNKHVGDPAVAGLTLADLVNDPIRPENLGKPAVVPLPDSALLTTDFYYISGGNGANAYSFLEMDDAVIAREAEKADVRYAFVRNISDPVVADRTQSGAPIADAVRSDWSGLIYNRYGLQTSYNGALATWATIAGDGSSTYMPIRSLPAEYSEQDPLEVKLVYKVRSCGSCNFFWPGQKSQQMYGPYTSYDFDVNAPYPATFKPGSTYSPWVIGRTRPPAFPEAEVVDGCRKAPIMTIGINPNLTAFAPGRTGAAWCYPTFYSENGSDAWAKYAWYYRYRSVYQERLDIDFVRRFILPEGRISASRSGQVTGTARPDDSAAWQVAVRYDGDDADNTLQIPGVTGDFPYVLLLDAFPPNNTFAAGDVIAGKMAVPGGIRVQVQQQPQGYYMQFVPVLERFQYALRNAGHPAALRIGEDVCQLDMVACASPHWNPGFLGGSQQSVDIIVNNCVSHNAWAIQQLVQTRPAVLYVVSESSWKMFIGAFGAYVKRDPPLSANPADHDFTLLRETTDPAHPCNLVLDVPIDGQRYQCTTRLVITPHFSYNDNFLPQFRLAAAEWQIFSQTQKQCVAALTLENGFTVLPPDPNNPHAYCIIRLSSDPDKAAQARAMLQHQFAAADKLLEPYYYDPHAMMASVLDDLFAAGTLAWGPGYLQRTAGPCQFCVNQHWQFPQGCPYGKQKEAPLPANFLEEVAKKIVAGGYQSAGVGG